MTARLLSQCTVTIFGSAEGGNCHIEMAYSSGVRAMADADPDCRAQLIHAERVMALAAEQLGAACRAVLAARN